MTHFGSTLNSITPEAAKIIGLDVPGGQLAGKRFAKFNECNYCYTPAKSCCFISSSVTCSDTKFVKSDPATNGIVSLKDHSKFFHFPGKSSTRHRCGMQVN